LFAALHHLSLQIVVIQSKASAPCGLGLFIWFITALTLIRRFYRGMKSPADRYAEARAEKKKKEKEEAESNEEHY